jgi:trehalose/maltose hydrolase-like predicted phosphorylase
MDARRRPRAAAGPDPADWRPINPEDSSGAAEFELPAYVSNGLIGLRVVEGPIGSGEAMLNGYTGAHPERRIETAARAPFPLTSDLEIERLPMSHAPHLVGSPRQSYDFGVGELTTRARFSTARARADIEVLTFCSRTRPSLACQEIRVTLDADCDVTLSGGIDARGVYGATRQILTGRLAGDKTGVDAGLLWESHGAVSTCGLAFVTEFAGAETFGRELKRHDERLETAYAFRAQAGRTYRLRQITSMVASGSHSQPDLQAARLAAMAARDGFETVRAENRAEWGEIWKGRIRLVGASRRWQQLADAAYFYLNTSTHHAAVSSTSIFGLAAWRDYHHYYGHVMWDMETFVAPVVALLQPHAAAAMLDYRFRHLEQARANAALFGRRGLEFPWESGPSSGEEAAPLPGSASWNEDHVSLDVARAFAFYADTTGDEEFLRKRAAPVLAGVAEWIESRVVRTSRGYEIPRAMGVAEREEPTDNAAYVNLAAKAVLRDATRICGLAGVPASSRWREICDGLVLPMRGEVVISHDGYRKGEEKGATLDPLMGVFPLGAPLGEAQARATLEFYLQQAKDYIGSPMLSALYGAWAARLGDRRAALRLLEEGYGAFINGRFLQTLEYQPDRFPEQPKAGPFFANIGGFLMSLLLGFPGLRPHGGPVEAWSERPAVLPAGWRAIESDRVWIRGRPMRLVARQGEAARLTPVSES